MMLLKCFAPMMAHMAAPFFILMIGVEYLLSKTLAFLLFQISQETNMTTEMIAFLSQAAMVVMLIHQHLMVASALHAPISSWCRPSQSLIMPQIHMEKRHGNRR